MGTFSLAQRAMGKQNPRGGFFCRLKDGNVKALLAEELMARAADDRSCHPD